ncbi:MAG: peptidoglycan DD-metalloendopeptidase family protein [Gemmatimonadaceae bacterium]|nr:peptidoglycan DD-metalloendopeptidase family protein [Gemmatimonadaceae bacterium]
MSGMRRTGLLPAWRTAALVLVVACAAVPSRGAAQAIPSSQRIAAQRAELERIRKERADLQRRMTQLQGTVHDLSEEKRNIAAQAAATARVVRSLDTQLEGIEEEVLDATSSLASAEDELTTKRAVLQRRLRDVYKRGPLYNLEVLLSAESFGGLVARYKILHALTLRDRSLVSSVERLRDQIAMQRGQMVRLQEDIARSKQEKAQEEERLRSLEAQTGTRITVAQRQTRLVRSRLAEIERSEGRLRGVIANLEDVRRKAEADAAAAAAARAAAPTVAGRTATPAATRAAAPAASTIRTADFGRLDWPVDGDILYRFGRTVTPENTTLRWNGIGIQTARGTPVKAIASGEVVVSENIGTYGLTVIVQHGAGDYSVYGSLAAANVAKGGKVQKGQVIGSVGTADPEMPPHLHFEIRRSRGAAVDPLDWLRGR